jgi:hypothetical protein
MQHCTPPHIRCKYKLLTANVEPWIPTLGHPCDVVFYYACELTYTHMLTKAQQSDYYTLAGNASYSKMRAFAHIKG